LQNDLARARDIVFQENVVSGFSLLASAGRTVAVPFFAGPAREPDITDTGRYVQVQSALERALYT
jgi:hypothetical protein